MNTLLDIYNWMTKFYLLFTPGYSISQKCQSSILNNSSVITIDNRLTMIICHITIVMDTIPKEDTNRRKIVIIGHIFVTGYPRGCLLIVDFNFPLIHPR